MTAADVLYESNLASLPLAHRGKVRDIYEVDAGHLLIVTTDRISAFDIVLPDPIPGKGAVLTTLSRFWFRRMEPWLPNHLSDMALEDAVPDPGDREQIAGRAQVVQRLDALPLEAIVRGYLIGSGWRDYQRTGRVCGTELPSGLRQADPLPEPIYTPSTKAEAGGHDENIGFEDTVSLAGGRQRAEQIRELSLAVYREAAAYARERGIIIADTKLELGVDADGGLVWIDEALTPDSSRFWPADQYRPGTSPPSFDKQFVRDYLESLDWDKTEPAPRLPAEIVDKTAAKYREAQRLLLGTG